MSYNLIEFKRKATEVSKEHAAAIDNAERSGKDLAFAEAEYHRLLAFAVARLKPQGATVAETLAKGEAEVSASKRDRDVAAIKDRAAVQRVKLAEADRAVLLTLGSWSKQEAV